MRTIFQKGKRIYLSPIELGDEEFLVKWANDSEITRFICLTFPVSKFQEEKWLREKLESKNSCILIIVLKENDLPIGIISLNGISQTNCNTELGIMIGEKEYWNNGYGSESIKIILDYGFNTLNLHKISLGVLSFNKRAKKAYEKCGFKQEGIHREGFFREGEYHDVISMSILRKEFNES